MRKKLQHALPQILFGNEVANRGNERHGIPAVN